MKKRSTDDPLWPFAGQVYDTRCGPLQTYQLSASDRIDAVKRMTDRAQLEAALAVPDLQKSVADAIRRRLRALGFVGLPT